MELTISGDDLEVLRVLDRIAHAGGTRALNRFAEDIADIKHNVRLLLRAAALEFQVEEQHMSEIRTAFDQASAEEAAALSDLGTKIADEAAQVQAELDALVTAQSNTLTEADVASVRARAQALQGFGTEVAALVPDAPAAPPVDTPPADGGGDTPPADGGGTPPADGGTTEPPADGGTTVPPADGGVDTPPADDGSGAAPA